MQTDTQTPNTEPTTSNESELGKLSFAEYQTVRRGGEIKSKQSAPELKAPEHKPAANSEHAETEEESEESSDDASDELDESKDQDDKPKKKGGYKRRIDKLIASKTAAQQELEYWKSQAMKNGATEQPKKDSPVVEAKSLSNGEPNPDDFETHAEYVKAVTKYAIQEDRKLAKQEEEKSKLQAEQERLQKSHFERVKSFSEKRDDFEDVLAAVDDVPISAAVKDLIISSENGPELMYELAKNRAEYERICKLSPLDAARAIGRIESKIAVEPSDEKKSETKKLTSAPKPLSTVGGSKGQVSKSLDDPNLSFSDYERMRRAQLKKR